MKKSLLTAAAVLLSIYSYGQTKGTSALSLGFSSTTNQYKNGLLGEDPTYKNKASQLRIGYGLFVSDNNKVGIDLLYNKSTTDYAQSADYRKDTGYGLGLNYQHYFPIVKTFYAFAGASGEYSQTKGNLNVPNSTKQDTKSYNASLAATGGLTWFISKRWALETNLVSVGAFYSKYEDSQNSNGENYYYSKTQGLSISTSQTFNNLGFKVYLMF
jgi:hypothetical protein